MEDIDPPREQPGASDEILSALDRYGFEWDGPVTFQSTSRESHDAAIQILLEAGMAYRCGCSRRDLADVARSPLGIIYPGTCRSGCHSSEYAIRVQTDNDPIHFDDQLQGTQSQALESESGDFIVQRRDGLIAYQLAVVVDDHLQRVTDIVRGIDLMGSTPRQIWLQKLLGYSQPTYSHVLVAINDQGQKLSKSHGAKGVDLDQAGANLITTLEMLGQRPPPELASASITSIWDWAKEHWDHGAVVGKSEIAPKLP